MSYAQTAYSQKLGNGPYSIADAGCFLTAFCNLLARLGEPIDPPNLNQYFINHGSFSHDPSEPAGLNDDLAWGTISAYDGQIATTSVGGAGWPGSNDAIVKFIYTSTRTHTVVTHFCLVADASAHTIVDSWDGVVKVSPYGTPVAWATYEKHAVQVVTPPAPAETPAFTTEVIAEVTKELKIDAHLWDLNRRSWPDMTNNPVGSAGAGTPFKTTAIAHHLLGGSYYLPEGSTNQGYNVVDTEDLPTPAPAPAPAATPAPTPAPTPANVNSQVVFTPEVPDMKKMYICKKGGAEKWNFKNVTDWNGFKSVQHFDYGSAVFVSGSALHPLGARYEIDSNDWNGYDQNGQPNSWCGFNKVDLTENRPNDLPSPAPSPVVIPTPVVPAATEPTVPTPAVTAPVDWKSSYKAFPSSQKLVASRELVVSDLSGQAKNERLPKYEGAITDPNRGVVSAYGTVFKDGVQYYRLRTQGDSAFNYWYSVPVVDPKTKKQNLIPYSVATASARGMGEGFISSLEKAIYAILPLWLKTKK